MLINRAIFECFISHNRFVMSVLLSYDFSAPILPFLLSVDGLVFFQRYKDWRNDNLGLHKVLRILIPQSICPLALHWLLLDSQVLAAIVLQRTSPEFFADLIKPIEDLVSLHVPKRLVFDIAIDVCTWHVGVSVALHRNFKLQMLIVFHVFGKIWALKGLADTDRRTAVITEIKPYVLQLWNTSTNHF